MTAYTCGEIDMDTAHVQSFQQQIAGGADFNAASALGSGDDFGIGNSNERSAAEKFAAAFRFGQRPDLRALKRCGGTSSLTPAERKVVAAKNLPAEALRHLRLQRTHYGVQTDGELEACFFEDVDAFAEDLRPFLPPRQANMRFIDIGCGTGFALLALLKIYGPQHRFVAVDRDAESEDVIYGFSNTPSAYNSLRLTREILASRGIPNRQIEVVDIDQGAFPRGSADVVASTLAWGFHFPVDTYLNEVAAVLAPGGVLFLDVRRGSGGDAALNKRFQVVHSWPGRKSDRLILRAP